MIIGMTGIVITIFCNYKQAKPNINIGKRYRLAGGLRRGMVVREQFLKVVFF
jgi:hypothetical protein